MQPLPPIDPLFNSNEFLHYPQVVSLVKSTMKACSNQPLPINLKTLYVKAPNTLLYRISYLFAVIIHEFRYLTFDYHINFRRAVKAINAAVKNEIQKEKDLVAKAEQEKKNYLEQVTTLQAIFRMVHARTDYKEFNSQFIKETKSLQEREQVKKLLNHYSETVSSLVALPRPASPNLLDFVLGPKEDPNDRKRQELSKQQEKLKNQIKAYSFASNIDFGRYGEAIVSNQQEIGRIEQKIEELRKNFFKLVDSSNSIQSAAETVEAPPAPATPNPHKKEALAGIEAGINKDMRNIWENFFKNFDEDVITGWKCDKKGNFEIQLKYPLKLWVPSTDNDNKEDPIGGIILTLGIPQNVIKGTMKTETSKGKTTSTMNFEDHSFSVFCRYRVPSPINSTLFVTPDVFHMIYKSEDSVLFGAGVKLLTFNFGKDREKSVSNLVDNWGNNGIVVGNKGNFVKNEDEDFLKVKIAEAEKRLKDDAKTK